MCDVAGRPDPCLHVSLRGGVFSGPAHREVSTGVGVGPGWLSSGAVMCFLPNG